MGELVPVVTNGVSDHSCEQWREREEMKSIGNKFAYLLQKGMFVDVRFLVGQNRIEYACHKLVLIASSNVFMAMLTGELAAASDAVIEIPDIEPPAFIASIEFLYTGVLTAEYINLVEVLYVAVKYDLSHLLDACSELMIAGLDYKNAATIYQIAKFFNVSYLQYHAYKCIREHPEAILNNSDFLRLTQQNVATIINQNDFIANELDIFNALMWWGENQCTHRDMSVTGENLRKVLGDSIYLIRFSRFIPLYISRFVVPREIYTDEEIVSIYQYSSLCSTDLEYLPPTKFSYKERFPILYDAQLFEVNDESHKDINFLKKSVTFSVDRNIEITHLILHELSESSNATYKVKVTLKSNEKGDCWAHNVELVCMAIKGFGYLRVNFLKRIPIYRYVWYNLVLESQKTLKTTRGVAKGEIKVNCGENSVATFIVNNSQKTHVDQIEFGFKI